MNNQNLSLIAGKISHLSSPGQVQRNVLKDGSSVFVKVISDKGGGVYEGSVAGTRVNITSSKILKPGSSFVATITAKDGTIYITPKYGTAIVGSVSGGTGINILQTLQPGQLAEFLANLGVPPNQLAGNVLKMMMQLEMKVDSSVIRNIYNMALKHKGKEKAAGELLLLLKEKGINISDDELEQLIEFLESDFSKDGYGSDSGGSGRFENQKSEEKFKRAKDILNKNNESENGWIFVPYNLVEKTSTKKSENENSENNEINGNNRYEKVIGAGVIRFLIDKSKKLRLMNLNCYYKDREYLFSLKFENKKCRKILFNINYGDFADGSKDNAAVKKLGKFISNPNIEIKWVDASLIEGCGSEGEQVYSFQGEA